MSIEIDWQCRFGFVSMADVEAIKKQQLEKRDLRENKVDSQIFFF